MSWDRMATSRVNLDKRAARRPGPVRQCHGNAVEYLG